MVLRESMPDKGQRALGNIQSIFYLEEIIMFKKILSLAIALIMVMGIAVVATSAAQVEVAEGAADAEAAVGAPADAEVGAEADADTGASGNTFSFDANSAGWQNFEYIAFHIWGDDETFFDWGSRKQRGKDDDGDGTWTYDLDAAGISLDSSKQYYVICYSSTGVQTYNLIAGTACYGDTVYCDGTKTENPVDSEKNADTAYWRGQDASVYGPEMAITSIGNIVGTCLPAAKSPYSVMVTFFKDTYANAKGYIGSKNSYKDSQDMVDTIAGKLGLQKDDVEAAIKESEVDVEWDKSKSTLPDGSNPDADKTPGGGTTPKTNETDSEKSTDSSNKNNSSGSGSSSSTKSGSGASSTTGQETTVLFIMLGVMVVAAGVIFFLRKKERA